MPSLISPTLKVQRAKEHLDSLQEAVKPLRQTKPYPSSTEDDLNAGEWVVSIEIKTPPHSLALVAGDFICCLRSSLDYLAWQLAGLTTPQPIESVCFPICGEDSPGTQGYIIKSTKGIPAGAVAIMKQFQPYTCGNAYETVGGGEEGVQYGG